LDYHRGASNFQQLPTTVNNVTHNGSTLAITPGGQNDLPETAGTPGIKGDSVDGFKRD